LPKFFLLELINPEVQEYAEKFTSPEDELLHEINDWTRKNSSGYTMLSGHLQGKLLEMISCMIRPKRILEIGTFMGYSALCMAKGLTGDGQLHTLEMNEKDAQSARTFFNRSSLGDKIILHTGNALKLIPDLKENWDLVFIDADKPAYIEYFNLVLPQVRKNGFILADNIFFHGEAFEDDTNDHSNNAKSQRKNGKAIRAFNEFIKDRTDIDKVILTVRDGLYLIRKL